MQEYDSADSSPYHDVWNLPEEAPFRSKDGLSCHPALIIRQTYSIHFSFWMKECSYYLWFPWWLLDHSGLVLNIQNRIMTGEWKYIFPLQFHAILSSFPYRAKDKQAIANTETTHTTEFNWWLSFRALKRCFCHGWRAFIFASKSQWRIRCKTAIFTSMPRLKFSSKGRRSESRRNMPMNTGPNMRQGKSLTHLTLEHIHLPLFPIPQMYFFFLFQIEEVQLPERKEIPLEEDNPHRLNRSRNI